MAQKFKLCYHVIIILMTTEGYFLSFLSSPPYKKQKKIVIELNSIKLQYQNTKSRKAITIMQIMTSNIKNNKSSNRKILKMNPKVRVAQQYKPPNYGFFFKK